MDTPEGEQLRTALDEVLASETFVRSPALARLLTYLIEQVQAGETASLKESVIGHVLYGLPAAYDPKLDSRVRVSANRLRARLEEHYLANPHLRVRIVLPKGAYVPQLDVREQQTEAPGAEEKPTVAGVLAPPPASSSTPAQQFVGSRWKPAVFTLLALAIVGSCAIFWMHTRRAAVAPASADWSVRPFARMGGSQQFGAFSPDGTRLAFTSTDRDFENKTIYIQGTTSEEAQRVALGVRPAWSPEGNRLAFLRPEANGKRLVIVFDLKAGKESVLTEFDGKGPWLCALPRLSWSKDGATLYSSAMTGSSGTCGIVTIDIATGSVRPLIAPISLIGDLEPAVSPNGLALAFMRGQAVGNSDVFVFGLQDGKLRRITNDGTDIVGLDWAADGKALIVVSSREGGAGKLWRMPLDGGKAQPLTDGSSAPTFPSVNPKGKEINFTQFHVTAPIWKIVNGKPIEILDNQSENKSPSLSPDGKRLLYASNRAGTWQIWVGNADGSDSRPIPSAGATEVTWPQWSPDGSQIAMECRFGGRVRVCISNADGSGFRQLTAGNLTQVQPSWSRDGRSIYFQGESADDQQIYRADVPGGALEQMTRSGGSHARESWDQQWLYVERDGSQASIFALPLKKSAKERQAAEEEKPFLTFSAENSGFWDACKDGIVYEASRKKAQLQLDVFDTQTRESKPLVTIGDFSSETNLSISVLPDGRGIVFTAGTAHSELNMMVAR